MPEANQLSPPDWLAGLVGEGSFAEIGNEVVRNLAELCGIEPSSRVLDAGCGVGRVAIPLAGLLSPEGSYQGFDPLPWAIDWCQREISSRYPNFSFWHADVFSGEYYPEGAAQPQDFRFPYDGDQFDVVCANSLFTHMLPAGLERYLSEIARVLKRGGRAFMTFYLLNDESLRAIEAGKVPEQFRFKHPLGSCRVTYKDAPEYAVAHIEEFVIQALEKSGVRLEGPVHYGRWCGRAEFLSWQDVIVAETPQMTRA
jgi:SAM-dependent methyltransferase